MSDPITALGLAAGVVQFVGFGAKIVRLLWGSYRAAHDSLEELPTPDVAIKSLRQIMDILQSQSDIEDETDEMVASLQELVIRCHETATQMLELLQKIKVPSKVHSQTRREFVADTLVTAWRAIWKDGEIRNLQNQLDEFRSQLTIHLLVILRTQGRKSLEDQQHVLQQLSDVVERTTRVENIGLAILDLLTARLDLHSQAKEKDHWQRLLVSKMHYVSAVETEASPRIQVREKQHLRLAAHFVAKLRFPLMNDREDRIPDAYKKTFHWIFESQRDDKRTWSNFRGWLQSDEPLYWITGKPGSGKSTLMKYICQDDCALHPICREHLVNWAGKFSLVTASFYFWNSGSPVQMSQRGLFRSLLSQLLDQAEEAVSFASRIRWETLCLFKTLEDPGEWSEQELRTMFRRTVGYLSAKGAKVCLFIDGLDEFDGDHQQLITLVNNLIKFPNVKVCVASRPWTVFEDAFKHKPSLMLEDLTYPDIHHFVSSKFLEDDNYQRLCRRDLTYANELINDVTQKSAGVFLWVHLVVFSLLTGMSEGDRISDLQRRLDALPADLEKLYAKILSTLDAVHLQGAVEIFQLIQVSITPASLLLLYFADEEDPEAFLHMQPRSLSLEQMGASVEDMRRRVMNRCKGLVEISKCGRHSRSCIVGAGQYTVQYLHRTVKDFLQDEKVHKELQKATKSTFDPHLRLCGAHLCWLKQSTVQHSTTKWSHVDWSLKHAARIRKDNGDVTIRLLDELDRTGQQVFGQKEGASWITLQKLLNKRNVADESIFPSTIVSLAVIYGITAYIEERVGHGCLVVTPSGQHWPLLIDIINHSNSAEGAVLSNEARLEMVTCLLLKGANPNIEVHDSDHTFSPWTATIRGAVGVKMVQYLPWRQQTIFYDPENFDMWLQIARLMIKHGANTNRRRVKKIILQQFKNQDFPGAGEWKEIKNATDQATKWVLGELCPPRPTWKRLRVFVRGRKPDLISKASIPRWHRFHLRLVNT